MIWLIWLGAIALPFLFFCILFILAFSGHKPEPFLIGCGLFYLGYLFWAGQRTRKKQPPRWLKWGMLVAFVGMFADAIMVSAQRSYRDSFAKVGSDINLTEYSPFSTPNKLATLDEPSSLTFRENYPRLDGATALCPVFGAFVQAVYQSDNPSSDFDFYYSNPTLQCNTTPRAYENLLNGKADIIFVAAPSKKQVQAAKEKGVEFHLTPIGKEAFVFFVNAKNPVDSLTVEQIQQIYSGKITNWKDVGGKKEKIRAFQRPEGSGSQSALLRVMGDVPLMEAPREDVVGGMGGIISQVATYRNYDNGLGYSFLFFTTKMVQNNEIKLLKINGIKPNGCTIHVGSYPFTQPFYAVTIGNESPETKALLNWILSVQGQKLILQTGYEPISLGVKCSNKNN